MPGVSSASFTLPANTQFIEFERTDADSSTWPKNTTRIVTNGEVNYMQMIPVEDDHTLKWRDKIGNGIAIKLGYPKGNYCLKSWPAGYAFFIHYKGKEKGPRTDPYLYGWKKARFRSSQEFIPHAVWLISDPTMNPINCECKYCSGKTQKQVAEIMPPGVFTSSRSPGLGGSLNKRPKDKEKKKELLRDQVTRKRQPTREAKMYAAVQPKPVPIQYTKSPNLHPTEAMLVEREQDLRAVTARTTILKLKRWYREGEVVWVALPKPIKGFAQDAVIKFWPGIVEENNLRIISGPQTSMDNSNHEKMDGIQQDVKGKAPERPDDDEEKAPWEVTQFYNYHIQLLAVNRTVTTPDCMLLPYQAYVPNSELMDELSQFPADSLDFNLDRLAEFHPIPPDGKEPGNFDQAVAPLGLAMQIGARLSDFWSLTDEWTFEYTEPEGKTDVARPALPPPPRPANNNNNGGANSLVAALQAASDSNSMSLSAIQPSQSTSSISSAPRASQLPQPLNTFLSAPSPVEMRHYQTRINGISTPGRPRTRIQFQGLWWGAERIWTDDFVRLKIPRRRLAPQGTDVIKSPSGPGEATRSFLQANGKSIDDEESGVGAGDRGTFMRLDGLYVLDVQTDRGLTKEVRAVGMVYELADEDWKEPSAQPPSVSAPPKFVPRPSPLNPHITASPTAEKKAPHLLPEPPQGFVFRPVLPENYEMVISLCMISGRYYPKILQHPLLEEDVFRALSDDTPQDDEYHPAYSHLFALEGLNAGVNNSVDPSTYKPNRRRMMEEALHRAIVDLENLKQQRILEATQEQDHDMEGDQVDELHDDAQGHAMDVDHF